MEDLDIVKFNKKFGIITKNQIILTKPENNTIYFDSIKKVKLTKNRVFYTNFTFLFLTILFATLLYLFFEIHIAFRVLLIVFSISSLFYSIAHKFYQYKIVIKLNNDEQYILKSTQLHRKCIKDFYHTIYDSFKKSKKVNYAANFG